MSDQNFERRLCRIGGAKPTARDRWQAFHRLWRMTNKLGAYHDIEAGICFRVLFGNWDWIHLLDGPESDGLVNRSRYPMFLRKRLLDHLQKKRLYGQHHEWKERDKVVARAVRERGIEVTPTEVAEVRRKVINAIRSKAAELDIPMPKDDDALLRACTPPR